MTRFVFSLTLACGLFAALGAHAACVTNGTDETLLFAVDSTPRGRHIDGFLSPDQTLCLPDVTGPVFHVFASNDEIEGCSRIAGPSGRDTLIDFVRYDNCRWASHDN